MRKSTSGFTLVEVLLVVSVIGILTTIGTMSYSRFLMDARDSQRSQRATVISEALEKYFVKNGEYPSCGAVTSTASTVTSSVLPGIDSTVLVTPKAATGQSNSLICSDLTTANGPDVYAFLGDGSPACSGSGSCLSYTIKYIEESTGTVKLISSRHTGNIATSGNIVDLSASPISFSQVNLSWSPISGSTSYNVQYSTSPSFSGALSLVPSPSVNNASVTGLTIGTLYYFRVQPVSSSSVAGNWSNTATASTYTLNTPVCTASTGPIAISQLQCSWLPITHAASYTIEYANNAGFSGATPVTNATSPYIVSGLTAGTTLYFHVKSVASGYSSSWSAPVSATTTLPAPVCSTTSGSSNTQIVPDWDVSTGAVSYTVQYGPGSYATEIAGITASFTTINGLNNGTTYTSRVKAVSGATSSSWTNCPDRTTGIDGPSGPNWIVYGDTARAYAGLPWMPGADPGYGTYWGTVGMHIYGTCSPGATVVTKLRSYYANSGNGSQNGATTMDWTFGNQDRYVVDGNPTWYVWWQGWVACQVGGTRVGDTYLGNAGPY